MNVLYQGSLFRQRLVDCAVDGGLGAVGGRLGEEDVEDVDLHVLQETHHVLNVPE